MDVYCVQPMAESDESRHEVLQIQQHDAEVRRLVACGEDLVSLVQPQQDDTDLDIVVV